MDQISGIVTRTNDKGFQLAERDGWVNISKFAPAEDVAIPVQGARVLIAIDSKGFARKVSTVEAAPVPVAAPAQPAGAVPGREQQIGRMAALNTATAILSAGGRAVLVADVLDVAAQLEAWVMRAA